MGDVGVGKTSLLSILWRAVIDIEIELYLETWIKHDLNNLVRAELLVNSAQNGIRYFSHESLITTLREHKQESNISQLVENARLILIDDFGRGHCDASGWNESLQDEFVDELWKNMVPVLITTNMNGAALRGWTGMERVIDRIGDPTWITALTIAGRSRRKAGQ